MKIFFKNPVVLAVLAAGLGYFVDVYDIILFSAVRVSSLKALGLSGDALTSIGLRLLNIQLIGMLMGGLLWGILGDKRGRTKILFGSILLYSAANLLNAFVNSLPAYAVLRFMAGMGLAGELGGGVTLVSELMPRHSRGWGTAIVAACGVFGGISGGLAGDLFSWRMAYIFGGVLGLCLLIFRWSVSESPIFAAQRGASASRGNLLELLGSPTMRRRYLFCLLLGLPIVLFINVFNVLSPEIGTSLGLRGAVSSGKAILFFNIGFGTGDLTSGFLSQWCQSRRKAAWTYLVMTACALAFYLSLHDTEPSTFCAACVLLGLGAGYWAVFLMISSEQFGTDYRATAAVSLPNTARALVVPCLFLLQWARPWLGLLKGLSIFGFASLAAAFFSLGFLRETFGSDLDFVEIPPG